MFQRLGKYLFSIIVAGTMLLPILVVGQTDSKPYNWQETTRQLDAFGGQKGANLGGPQDPRVIVARLIKTTLTITGIIALALAVYAGFTWMTAGGNDEKIALAKKVLIYSAVGFAIILMSYSITIFVYRGIYNSWQNPMTNDSDVLYIQPDETLYPDPLEGDTVIR